MINVKLGAGGDSNVSRYATAVARLVRPQFPELKFRFWAFEGDNAETKIEFHDLLKGAGNPYETADAIRAAVAAAEGETFPDKAVWNK